MTPENHPKSVTMGQNMPIRFSGRLLPHVRQDESHQESNPTPTTLKTAVSLPNGIGTRCFWWPKYRLTCDRSTCLTQCPARCSLVATPHPLQLTDLLEGIRQLRGRHDGLA